MSEFDLEKNLEALGEDFKVSEVQDYIKNMYLKLGWTSKDPRDRILYLTEEVGELARAVRKELGHSIDVNRKNNDSVEDEAADVFITLCALCNTMGVDLNKAFLQKQAKNCKRTWTEMKDLSKGKK